MNSGLTTNADRLVTGILAQCFRTFTATLGVRSDAESRCLVQQVRAKALEILLVAYMRREIKFGALLERLPISSSGNTWFATGHYARKSWTSNPDGSFQPQLLRGLDPNKDQSYYLSSISEHGLHRALFPLGDLLKSDVRELAKKYQLPTAERPESMGICFVGEKTRFSKFVCESDPPFFVTDDSNILSSFVHSTKSWPNH